VARLIYTINASLDGYIEDEDGKFDWGEPDEEVHTFFNDLERPIGTSLYGRRMYETMRYWETPDPGIEATAYTKDYASIWRAHNKIVYSKTLEAPSTERTRLERQFDPEAVRRLKDEADRDMSVGGPNLAAQAFKAGLVDECHLVLWPIVLGGGKRALPGGVRVKLELLDERRFRKGVVDLHYRVDA
jgi:dihydrofolate reductase